MEPGFSVLSEIFSDDGTNLDGDKLWAVSVTDTDKFMSLAKGRYMDNWEYLAGIVGYMAVLSLFLIPTVRKVS